MLKAARVWKIFPAPGIILAYDNDNELWVLRVSERGAFADIGDKIDLITLSTSSQSLPVENDIVYYYGIESDKLASCWSTKQEYDDVKIAIQRKFRFAEELKTKNFRVVVQVYEKGQPVGEPQIYVCLKTNFAKTLIRPHDKYLPNGNWLHERRCKYQDRVGLDEWVDCDDPRQKSP